MVLLNKTMMCGGLVVLAPGSPMQVLAAILIMLLHLLFVLKLAPYVKQSEDWSAFLSTLGLCLLSLGAYSMMLDLTEKEMQTIGVTAIPVGPVPILRHRWLPPCVALPTMLPKCWQMHPWVHFCLPQK